MEARLKLAWRATQRHLHRLQRQLVTRIGAARPRLNGHLFALAGVILLLGICSVAAALPARQIFTTQGAQVTQPTSAATSTKSHLKAPTAHPTAVGQGTSPINHKAKATATPTGEQTPLNLGSSTTTTDPSTMNTPWWQTVLDITWKLALVVGLIWLAMRALAALKQHGFSPKQAFSPRTNKRQRHFFEQIEEIQLAPQHVLHAVRAGDRVFLIARTQGALRALGEVDLLEETGEEEGTSSSHQFADQLFQAWAGVTHKGQDQEDAPPPVAAPTRPVRPTPQATHYASDAAPSSLVRLADNDEDEEVVEANWVTVKPNVAPPRTAIATITVETPPPAPPPSTELPLRRGTVRDSATPPPPEAISESLERDILWYAEEHSDSAAAKKYGLTRQRVTALRMRNERERLNRLLEDQRRERTLRPTGRPDLHAVPPAPAEEKPPLRAAGPARAIAVPDHPKGGFAAETRAPTPINRGSAARAYAQSTTPAPPSPSNPITPDVVPSPERPTDDAPEQAVTVGQILAARFGIKIPPTK
jgi:flagellar biogenesis protein FliO